MPIEILMPALSPTMTEGTLAKWLKKEGDTVAPGDIIAEIETDKATMEVEAVDEGTIGKIIVAGGTENVAVNAPIAVLLEEGEDRPRAKPSLHQRLLHRKSLSQWLRLRRHRLPLPSLQANTSIIVMFFMRKALL